MELYQNLFHSPPIHRKNGEIHILIGETVSRFGKFPEHFNCPAAYRFAFRFKVFLPDTNQLQKVCNNHIAVQLKLILSTLDDFLFHGVRLVPDISNDLFHHIFHRDDAERTAVFIRNNGKMLLCSLQGI